jgi:7-carboxy-7-deazaguanine synthase
MRKINEIFYSLQGEGFHTGIPAVFIRFSGCNLHCTFCDTAHETGTMMSDDDIVAEVLKHSKSRLIVLTGGEPSLFIDTDFVGKLKHATGMKIAIETNGTHLLPDNIDWITLSPKTDYEGEKARVIIPRCDELKIVYTGQPLDKYFSMPASHHFLQPCYCDDTSQCAAHLQATVQAVMHDPRWRLSLQTHRMLNIR